MIRISHLLVLALTVPLLFLQTDSAHAEFTIATVDVNRILNDSAESKAARAELDKISTTAKKKIKSRREQLQKTEEKIKSGKIAADSTAADKFRSDAREFSRYVKDTEEGLRRKFLKSNQKLTEKTLKLVDAYAKKNGIDLVLAKSNEVRGPVLFGTPNFDITDDIIKQVNG